MLRENRAILKVTFYPLIWIIICMVLGLIIGLIIGQIIINFDDISKSLIFIGLPLAILFTLPIIGFYTLMGIIDQFRGDIRAPRYYEFIDNGIRFRSDNGKFDRMFAWHEFRDVKYLRPFGVMRLIPNNKALRISDDPEKRVREFWITLKHEEYVTIENNFRAS